jgi:predicted nucleic acid-binding Zn ribbon protein
MHPMAEKPARRQYGATPERMRDVLRGALGRSLASMEPEDRIVAAWPVACGQRLAERTRILSFADGVLSVEVADSAWLKQMRSLSEKLKAELRSIAGVGVTDILFTLPATSAERHRAKL